MSTHYVHAPVASCGGCWTDYDREEWIVLPLVEVAGTVEERRCEGTHPTDGPCDRTLKLNTEGLEKMRAFIPWDEYAEMFPDSPRLADRVVRARPATLWQRLKNAWGEMVG